MGRANSIIDDKVEKRHLKIKWGDWIRLAKMGRLDLSRFLFGILSVGEQDGFLHIERASGCGGTCLIAWALRMIRDWVAFFLVDLERYSLFFPWFSVCSTLNRL
jgi:hypothetical protein